MRVLITPKFRRLEFFFFLEEEKNREWERIVF